MNDEIKKIVETLNKLSAKEEEHYEDLSTRMHAIEKWKWTVVGGAIAASLLASKVDFSKLFTFIP
jgi:hypothetical protein